jgi:hypothetical protein
MDTFLGRALTDPATGLPNLPYFCLVHGWEERKAARRNTRVSVIHVAIPAGSDDLRRVLMVRMCQEIRTSDLIASEGRDALWVLLTTPDAENAEMIAGRITQLAASVNDTHVTHDAADAAHTRSESDELVVHTEVQVTHERGRGRARGPCEPCDHAELAREPLAKQHIRRYPRDPAAGQELPGQELPDRPADPSG